LVPEKKKIPHKKLWRQETVSLRPWFLATKSAEFESPLQACQQQLAPADKRGFH
jgi:hypothetical protein